jgi:signal transduction histidine kinase
VVSEDYDLRNRLVRNIALHVASPVAIGLPLLIVLLWFSIRRGLKPLKLLTTEIEARKPDNLVPLDEGEAPAEVRPMIAALNQLLLRMAESLQGERRFTANAAHELKTPLATLQAQVYVVRIAQNDTERQRALDQLQRGVERGIRLVGQMLTMARLDPEQALPDATPMNLGAVVQQVCADLAPLALQRGQTLDLDVQPGLAELAGNADMVSMLASNLLDNAIRYTPPQGFITVQVQQIDGALCVHVSDSGPGIKVTQRSRIFERFYRLAQPDQPGTGLGLAICQRIAELHGATLSVGQGLRGTGTSVRLQFGPLQEDQR